MGRVARTFFALIVLIAPACGSGKNAKAPANNAGVDPALQNTLKMFDLHIQSFTDAKIAWDVTSPLGELFPANNTMRLHRMNSIMYDNGARSADLKSDLALLATGPNSQPVNGVLLADGDAYLSRNVVMVSTDGTRVETDWTRYSKKNDLIFSTAPVRVIRNDSITDGIGMEARPDMSELKIFKQNLVILGREGEE